MTQTMILVFQSVGFGKMKTLSFSFSLYLSRGGKQLSKAMEILTLTPKGYL